MDEPDLKQLFDSIEIPSADDNKRKETLNLAQAEFEKSEKTSQGSTFLSRLISRHSQKEREQMTISNRKLIYGGMATACVALLCFGIYPTVQQLQDSRADTSMLAPSDNNTVSIAKVIAGNDPVLQEKIRASESSAKEITQKKVSETSSEDPLLRWQVMPEARIKSLKQKQSAAVPQASMDMAAPVSNSVPASAPIGAMMGSSTGGGAMIAPMSPPMNGGRDGIAVIADSAQYVQGQEVGNDKFKDFDQNNVHQVSADPVSTFSIDVDTSSYSFVRQSLDNGVLPQSDAVRVEEMVNYFDYAYPAATDKSQPFLSSVVVKQSPWHADRKLMVVGIEGYDEPKTEAPDSNLVFLIDTSGSMNEPKKLPLLKQSLSMLIDQMKPTDKISIVVYAGSAGTVLPPTEASNKAYILNALNNLQAGGGTAGAEGINLAYQLAESNFNKKSVNRVILATDGDFNVGITNPEELKSFIERKRDSGIFLSVLGFGTGNYNDALMQELAQNGNGVAAYIDSLNEARKVLVQEASGMLFPIAKDVKIQVEFNPKTVSEYRLVGYETRALKTEDFNNDKVDAGDIGSGHEVTAIYEITPISAQKAIDDSRYAAKPVEAKADASGEYAFLKIRYKEPDGSVSKLITTPVTSSQEDASPELKSETDFAVAVAGFAQLLKGGKYTGSLTYDDILNAANASKGKDPFGYRSEFINLVYKAKTAAAMAPPVNSGGGTPEPIPVSPPIPVPQYR